MKQIVYVMGHIVLIPVSVGCGYLAHTAPRSSDQVGR